MHQPPPPSSATGFICRLNIKTLKLFCRRTPAHMDANDFKTSVSCCYTKLNEKHMIATNKHSEGVRAFYGQGHAAACAHPTVECSDLESLWYNSPLPSVHMQFPYRMELFTFNQRLTTLFSVLRLKKLRNKTQTASDRVSPLSFQSVTAVCFRNLNMGFSQNTTATHKAAIKKPKLNMLTLR